MTDYIYRVCAIDADGRRSAWSGDQLVSLADNAGIDDVECEVTETITVVGSAITYQGVPNSPVRLVDPMGRVVMAVSSDNAGRVAFDARSEGMYIVVSAGRAHKVLIKH